MLLLPLQLRCRRNPGFLLLSLSSWLRHGSDPGLHLLLLLPLSRPLLLRLLLLLLLPAGRIPRRRWWWCCRPRGPARAGIPGATLARALRGPLALRGGLRDWGPVALSSLRRPASPDDAPELLRTWLGPLVAALLAMACLPFVVAPDPVALGMA